MEGIIYKATNSENGKSYIGQTTTSLEKRTRRHYYDSQRDDLYFHKALRKYPETSWTWKIIDKGYNRAELNEKERFWISFFNSNNSSFGYNSTSGGDGVVGMTKESYDKARESRMKKGLSERGKQIEQSIKNFKRGKKAVLCLDTGIVYSCAEDAALAIGLYADLKNSTNAIRKCARGDTKTARGLRWEYLAEEEGRKYSPNAVRLEETGEIFRNPQQAAFLSHQSRTNIERCCNEIIQDNAGYHWSWVYKNKH